MKGRFPATPGLSVIEDFASVDGRLGFRFAARAVAVVGVAFVVEFLQARGRSRLSPIYASLGPSR